MKNKIIHGKKIAEINKIQKQKNLSGLIIQLPLPRHLNTINILNIIQPEIDVDCLTNLNLGKLVSENNFLESPTPNAIMEIFKNLKIKKCLVMLILKI